MSINNNNNNNNNTNNIPDNITAEWTVHAQLTISTKKPQQDNDSFTAGDHGSSGDTTTKSNTQSNPVTVIYKWSSGDDQHKQQQQQCSDSTLDDGDTEPTSSEQPTSFRSSRSKKDEYETSNFQNQSNNKTFGFANNNESSERKTSSTQFNRTSTTPTRNQSTTAGGISGNSNTNTAGSTQTYNSRCRSTCRIVLSACTDLFPLSSNNVNNKTTTTTTPIINTIDDQQPFGYNTTARCIISPDKSLHFDPPEISKTVQFLSVKDAFSQTSDTEQSTHQHNHPINKFKSSSSTASMADSYNKLSKQKSPTPIITNDGRRFRRPYDYRRITADSLISVMSPPSFPGSLANSRRESPVSSVLIKQLSPSIYDEGKKLSPSRQNQHHHQSRSPLFNKRYSPSNQAISTPTTSTTNPSIATAIQQDPNKGLPKKSPRTVHIDVYCTGSEAEDDTSSDNPDDDDDDDDDNDEDVDDNDESEDDLLFDDPHLYEEESNSTPQTVFNKKQIKLHHSRVTNKNDLPRRILNQKKKEKQSKQQEITTPRKLREYLLQNSTSKDEICESKQILFNKHIGTSGGGGGSRGIGGASSGGGVIIVGDDEENANAFVDQLPTTSSQQQQRKTNRNRFQYHQLNKDQSEDGLSSNYPNSSRSTVRDMTCSSISSGALASSSAIYDDLESSWKESDNGPSYGYNNYHHQYQQIDEALTPSDSLEYEPITPPSIDNNNSPILEQQQQQLSWLQPPLSLGEITAQKGWRSPEKERRFLLQQKKMIEFMHQNEKQMLEKPYEEEDNNKKFHNPKKASPPHYYIYNNVTPKNVPLTLNLTNYGEHQQHQQHQQQEPQPKQLQQSFKPTTTMSTTTTTIPLISNQHKKVLFTPNYNQHSNSSGYNTAPITEIMLNNNESNSSHWSRARKFGHIIGAMRKTGRHFGPAKNPDCQCDHCRRWMVERDQQKGRGRALSMGDEPFNRSSFWLARHKL